MARPQAAAVSRTKPNCCYANRKAAVFFRFIRTAAVTVNLVNRPEIRTISSWLYFFKNEVLDSETDENDDLLHSAPLETHTQEFHVFCLI